MTNPDFIEADDPDFIAVLGGMGVTEIVGGGSNPEYDIIKLHDGRDRYHSAVFYRYEIDDLITVLQYWRDHRPGRGRNVRS